EAAEDPIIRRDLQARHPAVVYWPTFQAQVDAGNGRAVLWMVVSIKDLGMNSREARAEKARLLRVLGKEHFKAVWFGEVLTYLPRERRTLRDDELSIYLSVIDGNEHRPVQAFAMYQLAEALLDSKDPESMSEGHRYMDLLAADYPETSSGGKARELNFKRSHLELGKIAPDFDARTVDGQEFKLSDYRGKVVLIDFYGFWCVPCRAGMPHLKELLKLHKDAPFAIIGVNTGDKEVAFRAGLKKYNLPWISAFQGRKTPIADLYQVTGYPTYWLLDAEGQIIYRGHDAEAVDGPIARSLASMKR
ncbi:MAG: thiol-disulfide isomerase/thioredoxin, partial [Chlamydiales bacterium]